jgi:iron(III) transport system substrate-binding protein
MQRNLLIAASLAALLLLVGCPSGKDKDGKPAGEGLVLYSAGNEIFSQHIIDEFKKETGIVVKKAGDTEVTRGVFLRTRIIKEKDNVQADVYWNNELANTIVLQQEGLLAPYKSPSASEIPEAWKDAEGYWTAFGLRARVFIVNTEKVKKEEMPTSMYDMLDPKWKGKVGISKITGGTTATHAAALFELLGEEKAKEYYAKLKEAGVVICQGNGHVMEQVRDGELFWGWTDTNDCNIALKQNKPVTVVYPDQGSDQIGTLLIPHSVCLIKGGPNPENAKKFIDFLLRKETERKLAFSDSVQVPVRKGVEVPDVPPFVMDAQKIKNFNGKIDFTKVARRLPGVIEYMNQNFNN